MYEMKPEYFIGIPSIDEEHSRLFEIAEEIYQLQRNEFIVDKYDNISAILHKLKDYTIMHFNNEEEYMMRIGYKKLFTQKVQHDAFKQKLDELNLDHLDDHSDAMITELLKFLTDWLVHHILETDKQIAEEV
ncbi:bacteriohemerythrin [Sporanaerobium hydrogeniformans]|uniref:Bacteriohemerythrin n=1 Tax=Sporanaerobium hydrogeniformans TaxID=3072179 RepID=A0AC61DDP1_9FIRM|nr:hemerythrin family protein [Sporanaerobium hydrogeniformans]PHV71295.1 bacteriohemerythrin [Sporanaerobium hydrogeniformans]